MEPRPCGRGNFQQALVQAAAQKASMEPRPCGRGNIHAYTHPLLAVLLLQWSHDLAVVETLASSKELLDTIEASMEPRPCGRGNFQQALVQAAAQKASMEPRPCGRGNSHAYTHPSLAVLLLQWSHDLAVVETLASSKKRLDTIAASMAPPPFCRANFQQALVQAAAQKASMEPR